MEKNSDERKSRKKPETEKDQPRSEGRRKARHELLDGLGGALLKVVIFWCTSGVMLAAIYTGIVRLASGSVSEVSGNAKVRQADRLTGDTELQTDRPVGNTELQTDRPVGNTELQTDRPVGNTELQTDRPVENTELQTDGLAGDSALQSVQASLSEVRKGLHEDAGGDTAKDIPAEPQKKTAALTFDDGPHPVYTAELLDGLKERGVQATFFVVGKNIQGNEDLIARMEVEGHLIGNHTYDHVKISDMSQEDACSQVEKTSALVQEITGHHTEFVRPPFGAWKKNMECSFVMIPVLWDVDPLDWTTSDASLVVQRVVDEAEDQDIILLHDCYESSVQAALQIVDVMQEEGYEFVTVDQLVLD